MARKTKTVKFQGKVYRYKTARGLAKTLRISESNARKLVRDSKRERIIIRGTEIGKFSLADHPVVFSEMGIKKPTRTQLIKGGRINGSTISNTVPRGKSVSILYTISIRFTISANTDPIERTHLFNITSGDQYNRIIDAINNYLDGFGIPDGLQNQILNEVVFRLDNGYTNNNNPPISNYITRLDMINQTTGDEFRFVDGKLRDAQPLKISHLYSEQIVEKNWVDGNCVKEYLKTIHKKSAKAIDKLGDSEGVSIEEINAYCVKKRIKMIIYGINRKVVKSHYPEKRNRNYKNVIGIAYNNHFYPLKHAYLHKTKYEVCDIKVVEDIKTEMLRVIKTGVMPADVKINKDDIISFVDDNKIKYICNPEYAVCKEILTKFGIADKIHDAIGLNNITKLIEPLYLKENVSSFIPNISQFVRPAYNYQTDETDEPIKTIDKNMCYSSVLKSLKYLITTDFRTERVNVDFDEITDEYLYIAEPLVSSLMMPSSGLYTGRHLRRCADLGIEYEALEELTTEIKPNYFSRMVTDIYEFCGKSTAKKILNVFIGKFEQTNQKTACAVFDRICNRDEAKRAEGFDICEIGDYVVKAKMMDHLNIYTRKPISVQVKDEALYLLYRKMQKMNISPDQIVQVKTDSFSFYTKGDIVLDETSEYIDGWKVENYKPLKGDYAYTRKDMTFLLNCATTNVLEARNAGCGKTTKIINEIIPQIEKSKTSDYIVLSPSHATILDYRKQKLNCSVIQAYTLSNRIPKESVIIVDEMGLLDRQGQDLIYKCFLMNKEIYCFGDFYQQLPVGELKPYDNPAYLEFVYNEIESSFINYRNKFTEEYYNQLKTQSIDVVKEVHRYDSEDPEVYIAYRKDTVRMYNERLLKERGFNSLLEVGVLVVCKTNELRDRNIYNNYALTVKEVLNNTAILTDDVDDYTVDLADLENPLFFQAGYCRTTYAMQGRTIGSYKFCAEDDRFLKFYGVAYTIISRIRA